MDYRWESEIRYVVLLEKAQREQRKGIETRGDVMSREDFVLFFFSLKMDTCMP